MSALLEVLAVAREDGPEPDWTAADASRTVEREVLPEAWKALPPVRRHSVYARDDVSYTRNLASWYLDNMFDRHDVMAAWDERSESWFCDKDHTRETIENSIVKNFSGTGPDKYKLVGSYYGNPVTGSARGTCIDIDSHKGEDADSPLARVERTMDAYGFSYILTRSKGGRGFNSRNLYEDGVPIRAARNFGLEILTLARLDHKKTEVFPKNFEVQPFGTQVALPGSRYFRETRGGSFLMRPITHEEIEFKDWLSYLESVPKITVAQLRDFGKKIGVDLWTARKSTYDTAIDLSAMVATAVGQPDLNTIADVRAFLHRHGLHEGDKDRGATPQWTHRIQLAVCVNVEAHGTVRLDGAAVLFNEKNGNRRYICQHAGCKGFGWPAFMRKLGYQVEWVLNPRAMPVPAPLPLKITEAIGPKAHLASPCPAEGEPTEAEPWSDPRDDPEDPNAPIEVKIDARARFKRHSEAGREALRYLAINQFKQTTRGRQRMMRVANCGHTVVEKGCEPAHGVVHKQIRSCGYVRTCPYCASKLFAVQRLFIQSNWPERMRAVVFDPPDDLWRDGPSLALRRVRLVTAQWRKWARKRRVMLRRWMMGLQRGVFFLGKDEDADYLMDEMRARGVENCRVVDLTAMTAGDLAYDISMEPALRFAEILDGGAMGMVAAVDYPFLVDDEKYRCSDGNRSINPEDRLPWLTEQALRVEQREAVARRYKERGEEPPGPDPRTCPIQIVRPDGTRKACGCLLRPKVYIDGRHVHTGLYGAPGWSVAEDALSAHALECERRGEMVHQT